MLPSLVLLAQTASACCSSNPYLQIDRLPDLLQSGTGLHQLLADEGSQRRSIDNTKT